MTPGCTNDVPRTNGAAPAQRVARWRELRHRTLPTKQTPRKIATKLAKLLAALVFTVCCPFLLICPAAAQSVDIHPTGPAGTTALGAEPPAAHNTPADNQPATTDDTGRPATPQGQAYEFTPTHRLAIQRGLQWLADEQAADGSYGRLSHYGPHVGLTALAGMAFMSDGSTPGRGRYGENVERCVDFILDHASESGLFAAETSHGPMYGHGFATLFMAEVYGMSPRSKVREALRKAVRLIVSTQNEEGGWRYQPVRNDADISVTICQIMALRAARNAGIYVPKDTVDRAIDYVKDSQNIDGGFRYMRSSGGSAFARSAAGVAALQYAGIYTGREIDSGLAYIRRFLPPRDQTVGHYFYGHYYAAQAMYLAGDREWRHWFPAVRDELVGRQAPEGFWRGQAGNEYGSAMALIILQMPNRLLPIFQK